MFVWEISSWPKRRHLSVSHFKTYDLPWMPQAYTQEELREFKEWRFISGKWVNKTPVWLFIQYLNCNVVVHTVEYYVVIKRNEVLIHATPWINLTNIVLSERIQMQRPHVYDSFVWNVHKRQISGDSYISGCPELRAEMRNDLQMGAGVFLRVMGLACGDGIGLWWWDWLVVMGAWLHEYTRNDCVFIGEFIVCKLLFRKPAKISHI